MQITLSNAILCAMRKRMVELTSKAKVVSLDSSVVTVDDKEIRSLLSNEINKASEQDLEAFVDFLRCVVGSD